MIITITGKNDFQARQRLTVLTAKFAEKYGDMAVEKLEAAEMELSAILEAIQSVPFLSKKKLVVLRDLGQNKIASENIEQIINSISESTDVIVYDMAIDRRSSLFKVLKAESKFEDFPEIDAQNLPKWLVAEAKNQGSELSISDANYLVQRLGADQNLLASELNKLITFNPKISRESIDLLTEPTPQSRIFDLLDAAFKQDKAQALKLYDEQRAQKVEPQAILAMLAWQLRLLVIASTMGEHTSTEVARDMGVSEFPLRKAQDLAAKLDSKRIKAMVNNALTIDLKSKTTALDLDEALKTYITTL